MKRCQNVADSCWREFTDGEFHIRIGDKVFCSQSCAQAWLVQNKVFEVAASPHEERVHTARAKIRLNGG